MAGMDVKKTVEWLSSLKEKEEEEYEKEEELDIKIMELENNKKKEEELMMEKEGWKKRKQHDTVTCTEQDRDQIERLKKKIDHQEKIINSQGKEIFELKKGIPCCPICMTTIDSYNKKKICALDCGHLLCEGCLKKISMVTTGIKAIDNFEDLLNGRRNTPRREFKIEVPEIRCPTCRVEFDRFKYIYF